MIKFSIIIFVFLLVNDTNLTPTKSDTYTSTTSTTTTTTTTLTTTTSTSAADNGKVSSNMVTCPYPPKETLEPCTCQVDEHIRQALKFSFLKNLLIISSQGSSILSRTCGQRPT